MPATELARLDELAAAIGCSRSSLVRTALRLTDELDVQQLRERVVTAERQAEQRRFG